ncbi:MAG: hypothetical protein GX299_09130 [Epulopiscium sp.]|jgi:regulatory protein|nr:hypothetical protein [Candidatus Epulonipiscium sp.]
MLITAITPQKNNAERASIFIDGEFAFGLSMQDVLYFKLKEQQEISKKTYTYIKEQLLYIKAQDAALHYISYQMRTESEVRKKLKTLEYGEDVIERVIDFLLKYRYVDDLSFAAAYIRQRKKSNPKGRYALRYELRQKGVSEEVIDEALEEEPLDELDDAVRLLQKKARNLDNIDEKATKRLGAFLQRRGYSYAIIKEAMQRVKEETV